jgi:2-methylcitrate dehydratase PrpD
MPMAFTYPDLRSPSYAAHLARFVTALTLDDVPSAVLAKAKVTVLDTLGCALAGRGSPASQAALAVKRAVGGTPEASLIGVPEQTSCVNAAFVNAIMAKCYDFDGPQIGGHNAPILIPVALALAERDGRSGRAVLEGIVAGVEVMGRVAKALGPEHQVPHGFHSTATTGVFGATATAGKLLRLDATQMTQALGIAGSCVGGTEAYLQPGGAWTNALHCGKPAADGITCALLAREGFTGPRWIFEGIDGILQAYAPRGTTNPVALNDRLGAAWYFGDALIGYKRYACCGSMHGCLDAFAALLDAHHLDPDAIAEVTTWSNFHNYKFNCVPRPSKVAPQSIVEGIFSLPFCLAMLAHRRAIHPVQWRDPGILDDAAVLALARKVRCLVDYDAPRRHVRVDVRMTAGDRYTVSGVFHSPFTVEELDAKFAANNAVTGCLDADGVATVRRLVGGLEAERSVAELMATLSGRR